MKFSTVLSIIASASLAAADISLREAAKDKIRIGVATDAAKFSNPAYIEAVNEFNTMVAENGCKLSSIQPQKGVFDFSSCDAHYEKAVELGQKFRGHCLIWFNYQPQWFQDITDHDEMEKTIVEHITKVLTHYKGKIDTWDVVNEAIEDESTGENGTWELRDTFISRALPDFIDIAFKTAREVDPSVKLFYNDYDIEGIDIRKGMKTNAVYNFVKDMVDRGVPIDGVGLQYHLHTDKTVKYENVMETMKRFADLGLEVQITEMDVNSVEGKTEESFKLQGQLYGEGLQACLDSPNCTGFLIWGVGDSDSWRKDGYPLAFNDDYTPKPAYYAMLDVLKKYNNIVDEDIDDIETGDVNSAAEDAEINDSDAEEVDAENDGEDDTVGVLDNNSDVEDDTPVEGDEVAPSDVAAENNESEAEDAEVAPSDVADEIDIGSDVENDEAAPSEVAAENNESEAEDAPVDTPVEDAEAAPSDVAAENNESEAEDAEAAPSNVAADLDIGSDVENDEAETDAGDNNNESEVEEVENPGFKPTAPADIPTDVAADENNESDVENVFEPAAPVDVDIKEINEYESEAADANNSDDEDVFEPAAPVDVDIKEINEYESAAAETPKKKRVCVVRN